MPLWMEVFVESYFEKVKGICFQVAKAKYLEQLAHQIRNVKFVGIAVSDSDIEQSEILAQIFVMPDVREERSRKIENRLDPILPTVGITVHYSEEAANNYSDSLQRNALIEEQRAWATRDRSSPRIPAPKILNRSQKKAVVLGAPGSGKTMLVSYFALMLCETQQSDPTQIGLEKDTLPIVVRIRDWILQPKMGLLEYLEYYAKTNLCTKELPTGFFEHWLERGRALILLDGLDEVVDEAQRRKVAEQIETFLHRYQSNPAVITSRPAGYRWDFFNLEEFPHYTLESFDDKQVATFIDHWYDSRIEDDSAQVARRKADLQSAFARNERIRLLAKNPLLLTIIALIHRYQAELPRQRFKLYEKAVETLLTSWDSGKEIKLYETVLRFLKPDDLLYILKKLAYWIHTQGSTGETEGGTLIDKDELLRQLQREIKTLKKCEPHEAKGEAERFIDFIQRRTGLLNEQGRDRYAFVHKTFQEYLTAEEIFEIDESQEDPDIIWRHFQDHLHDPHWREVLLLLVSKLKGKKAQKAIQAVLDKNSEYEQWLHRDLLFAGWCLTEDPSRLMTVAPDFVGDILDRLVALVVDNAEKIGGRISNEAVKIIHCFGETSVERTVWEKLQTQGGRIERFRLLGFQASLGQKKTTIEVLLNLLENQHGVVSLRAMEMLVKLGHNNEKVINCLLNLLYSEQPFIFVHAAKILFQLGNSKDAMMQHFLFVLDNEDPVKRIGAAQVLVQLGNISDRVVISLLSLLNDENSYVRGNAASALGELGNSNSAVLSCLLAMLGDRYPRVRSHAAESLMQLGNSNPEVINCLLDLLDDEDSHVRSSVASALVQLGSSNPDVINCLLALLGDEDSYAHSRALNALETLAKTSDTICPEVVQWLEQNPNNDGIGSAIDCLWSIVVE
jgi:tetratricopeptide (TPR) repeat protein